jgi:hypothetical protein
MTGTYDWAPITGEVVIIDATSSALLGNQSASLWEYADSGLEERETVGITSGLAFNTPFTGKMAVTLASDHGTSDGYVFFRSGIQDPLSALRLEIVLAPEIRITAADLDRWLTSLLPIEVPFRTEGIDGRVTVTGLSSALEPGVIGVALRGSLTGTAWGFPLMGNDVAGTLRCRVGPATSPDARYALTLDTTDPGSTLHLSGSTLAMVANLVLGVMVPLTEGAILDRVSGWLDTAITAAVCRTMLLPELQTGVTLTIRYMSVDQDGLILFPALGAIGTLLTTYDPPPVLSL